MAAPRSNLQPAPWPASGLLARNGTASIMGMMMMSWKISMPSEARPWGASICALVCNCLSTMAVLLSAVGAMGLTSLMSMNVLERTREIGVVRSVGAGHRDVMGLVLLEGLVVGALSGLLGLLAAVPLGHAFSAAVGVAFLGYFGCSFDLVASGINYGSNLGDDITYSGTVGAAMEAVLSGCPAFAMSQEWSDEPDFELAGEVAAMVARNVLEHGLGEGELLNVNTPARAAADPAEIDLTRMGKRVYQDKLLERLDPRGVPYYWFGGPPPTGVSEPGTDFHAVASGRVSVAHNVFQGRSL